MEDVRIGRDSDSQTFKATSAGANPVALVPGDPNRIALFVSGNGASTVFLGPGMSPPSATQGIALTAGDPFIELTLEKVGSMLRESWFIADGGVPVPCFAIATSLRKQ